HCYLSTSEEELKRRGKGFKICMQGSEKIINSHLPCVL
ncbi:hypothetical protein K5549_017266, partial [Capra hircus]